MLDLRLTVALLGALVCTACPPPAGPTTYVTFNAGLAVGFVPAADERAPGTSDAVAALDADVVCLQEYWEPEHIAMVDGAAAEAFPDRYFPDPAPEVLPAPACLPTEADPDVNDIDELVTCIADNCGEACGDELPDCVLSECALEFLRLETDCLRCVQANVSDTPEGIRETCTTEATEYVYGGSFGTGLLSTLPMVPQDPLLLSSTTTRRSLLHAVVTAPEGDVDVFCTHLTAVFSLIPYPRDEGDWDIEQAAQVTAVREFIAERATTGRTVLLGDMNAGPPVRANEEEQIENWEALAEGWEVPFVDIDQRCTFCPDNPLSSVDSDARGRLIDHVMFQGFEDRTKTPTRVLDDAFGTESCGEPIAGAYSDHYGVSVTVEPP